VGALREKTGKGKVRNSLGTLYAKSQNKKRNTSRMNKIKIKSSKYLGKRSENGSERLREPV